MLARFREEQRVVIMNKVSALPSLLFLAACLLINISDDAYGQTPVGSLSNGLINYYTFDGTPNDSSGTNDGLVSGNATLSANRFGSPNTAYKFPGDGTGSIRNQTNFPLTLGEQYRNAVSSFSLSIWFYATGSQILFSEAGSGTRYWYYDNFLAPGIHGGAGSGIGFMAGTNGVSVYEHGHQFISPVLVYSNNFADSWIHAVVTIEQNGPPVLYINGEYARTGIQSGRSKLICPLDAPDIGGLGSRYSGSVDDLGIWDRALSAAEVDQLYRFQKVPVVLNPLVKLFAPANTPLRLAIGPTDITNVTATVLPSGWKFDTASGQIFGRLTGTNPMSALLTGQRGTSPPSYVSVPVELLPQVGQSIAFTARASAKVGNIIPLLTTSSSKLPVSVTSSDPNILRVDGSNAAALSKGRVTLTAIQDGNEKFAPATPITRAVTVR
jgi:Concanavalin A-like lectin/glucanases superfamily